MSLNHDAPYPGDELRWGAVSSHRFGVFRLNEDTFTVADTESGHGELTISASLLQNPKFHIGACGLAGLQRLEMLSRKAYTSF
ncbi:hypothetical protein ARMGADRAFT_1090693 [Armillaria gallica]|uniref:Uncharacterized protein n=1 Tax=Armillaria gallica TaxID=47427 RepID=A0A2H3CJV0_ARMGA|nr:hypothetical protein ARMGADRAFT_1090693 [Armillaria gallica]